MSRLTAEWTATNDDQAIPPRVKIRVFAKFYGKCAICTLLIVGKLRPAFDHRVAIINGGRNSESNLQLLCVPCHKGKTKADVAEKSITARVRAKHLGIKKPSRFFGSRDSEWKKKINGTVVRR